MNCPVCGKEMEPGFVQTNQPGRLGEKAPSPDPDAERR